MEKVKVVDLVQFIKNEFIGKNRKVYLMKLDIEGAEFELAEGIIKEKVYEHIKHIVIEEHSRIFPDGEQKLERLRSLISQNGITNIDLEWV
ncbi:hypothetical protein AGMMS49959_09860 [Planctomycetales bacterium]|nr:hypothetical protein AGMMS49959_09860 [Planctomycetales bacterium]